MSWKAQLALLLALPVAIIGALYALGAAIPVPVLGRTYVVEVALPDGTRGIGLPDISGPADPTRPLVVIDAGHGGADPGAVADGLQEKAIVLQLALALRDRLLAEGGIRVALTRETDRLVVLGERAVIARELGADLFLSIHADSAGDQGSVTGASIYTLSQTASSEAAARFAARENEADTVNGVDLSGQDGDVGAILIELSQRRTSGQSAQFAQLIEREGEGTLRFHPQAQRSAALAVLRAPDVPSVLFEAGFITNADDAGYLVSEEGQRDFADVMARAIRIYFARAES